MLDLSILTLKGSGEYRGLFCPHEINVVLKVKDHESILYFSPEGLS